MKILLESDIHLEISRGQHMGSNVASDVAVCAGDIGTFTGIEDTQLLEEYFEHRRSLADHVIWVLGNHEYYHQDYHVTLEKAVKIALRNGILLMDEAIGTDNQEIDGVKFWGTTLWTDFHDGDWHVEKAAANHINDFYVVKNGVRRFSTQLAKEINYRSRQKINWDADVVITHFAPIMLRHPRFPISPISYYFYNTGLENQIIDSNLKLWLYGHTHHSRIDDLGGTLVASNQLGYHGGSWDEDCGFVGDFVLEI